MSQLLGYFLLPFELPHSGSENSKFDSFFFFSSGNWRTQTDTVFACMWHERTREAVRNVKHFRDLSGCVWTNNHFWQLITTVSVNMANLYVLGRISKLRSINRWIAGKKSFKLHDNATNMVAANGHMPWPTLIKDCIESCILYVRMRFSAIIFRCLWNWHAKCVCVCVVRPSVKSKIHMIMKWLVHAIDSERGSVRVRAK